MGSPSTSLGDRLFVDGISMPLRMASMASAWLTGGGSEKVDADGGA